MGNNNQLQIHGTILNGYVQAFVNLNIIAGNDATALIQNINFNEWYPLSKWSDLEKLVMQSYKNYGPILERAGIEMMNIWYHYGPGKEIVKKGIEFLHFQTGSQGYANVVKGPAHMVGEFTLKKIDENEGYAKIFSTTPFHRKTECGVLIGGMLAPGDINYIDVVSDEQSNYLEIEFH